MDNKEISTNNMDRPDEKCFYIDKYFKLGFYINIGYVEENCIGIESNE